MSDQNRPVLLIGSVNLPDRDTVFAGVAAHLRDEVRSVPDGETGERGLWASWEAQRIENLPGIEVIDEMVFQSPVAGEFHNAIMAPAEGVDLSKVQFGPFNYVKEAVASYETFRQDREAGKFRPDTRFQVSIPTAMLFAMMFPKNRLEALAAFERDLGEEVARLLAAIPPEDLAVQWDIAGETQIQEQFRTGGDSWDAAEKWPLAEVMESVARLSAGIPETVLLGIHLCYGDPDGTHIIEPRDLSVCVDLANSAAEQIGRRLDWIHMPVPIDREDEAYFAPLAALRLAPETTLYLGLVHKEDGLDGARKRVAQATKFRQAFGVATECGMGREPEAKIDELLELHHAIATL